jgi:hypothetical protein
MKKNIMVPVLTIGLLALGACGHHDKKEDKKETKASKSMSYQGPISQETVSKVTATWPESSRAATNGLIEKYGLPSTVSNDMIVWNNTAPFKRSIVYREEVNHQFPIQHADVLEQTIDYRVPKDKVEDLARLDGSLLVDRTKGELSARNEQEEMNFLALNLADKVVRGEMTVEAARMEYSRGAQGLASGNSSDNLTGLNFKMEGDTSDPDRIVQPASGKMKKNIQAQEVRKVIEEEDVE